MHFSQMPVMRVALTWRHKQMLFLGESSLLLSLLTSTSQSSVELALPPPFSTLFESFPVKVCQAMFIYTT